MPTLIERDYAPAFEAASNPVPVAGVGAEAVKKEHRCLGPRALFRSRPLDVMKTDAVTLEPSVGRFGHRL
ncbi:MAG: hypothetical protein AUI42_04485 [Actinobacteria bacterium 13_1_40CM_2_65_8]|nr:MAG: hypothetical protein AUI42_04485 [Actinobacteria bacterium 13_1_40CM_2_65_8]